MIGVFAGEDFTVIEFRPIAASELMSWASIVIKKPLPEKCWGEWGVALSRHSLWVYKKNETRFLTYPKWMRAFINSVNQKK